MKKKYIITGSAIAAISILLLSITYILQAVAVQQALDWRSNNIRLCAAVITPAIHKNTGAHYTFNDSCLPPGWESEGPKYSL